MFTRKRINLFVIMLLGLGIPTYYRAKYFLAGLMTLEQILKPAIFVDYFAGLCMAVMAIFTHEWIVFQLRKQFPQKTDHAKRFLIQFISSATGSVLALWGFNFVFYGYIYPYILPKDYYLDMFLIGLFIPILINGIKESLYYYGEWEDELLQKEKLQKENIRAQYEILKNQINPHFLFNCFNTLTEVAHQDKELTIQFIQQLSRVYRFVLENKDQEVVDLKNELKVLESYVFLLKIRFGENLNISMNNTNEQDSFSIVPLTLQILMENALKHNIVSKENPLNININVSEDNMLIFSNNLQRKPSMPSTHIGLQNIINRYQVLANQTIDIIETDSEFTVKIPLFN